MKNRVIGNGEYRCGCGSITRVKAEKNLDIPTTESKASSELEAELELTLNKSFQYEVDRAASGLKAAPAFTPNCKITSDAAHPANIRIIAPSRRHVAKFYADSLERDPVCEANALLFIAAPALYAALQPFAEFARQWNRQPLRGVGDEFYSIHSSTEYEASLRITDCQNALAAIKLVEENRPLHNYSSPSGL